MRRALVLAGGGYVASSWEIGLITGMADVGLDVRNADLFVGTSTGARVALDLTSGKAFDEIYQLRAGPAVPALGPNFSLPAWDPVVNLTGLTDGLHFTFDRPPFRSHPEDIQREVNAALQRQPGLKLEPRKAPLEMIVIGSPFEN